MVLVASRAGRISLDDFLRTLEARGYVHAAPMEVLLTHPSIDGEEEATYALWQLRRPA